MQQGIHAQRLFDTMDILIFLDKCEHRVRFGQAAWTVRHSLSRKRTQHSIRTYARADAYTGLSHRGRAAVNAQHYYGVSLQHVWQSAERAAVISGHTYAGVSS